MSKSSSSLSDVTESLGVLSLENLKVFGDSTSNSSMSGGSGSRVSERLNKERLRALETLEKAHKTKLDTSKKPSLHSTANKENAKAPTSAAKMNASSRELNGTDYVPHRCRAPINISELITNESISLEYSGANTPVATTPATQTSTDTKVSFEPAEITGRSTHYTAENRSQSSRKASFAALSSRLSVGDILASSFAPKARDLCEALRASDVANMSGLGGRISSAASSSFSTSRSLPRTADMSHASLSTEGAFGNGGGGGSFSFSTSTSNGAADFASEDFQPAELVQSKLLLDEIMWAQEFATIPTAVMSKEANAKNAANTMKDFDVRSINSSMMSLDPNFSVGRFFNQRSEDIQNIVEAISPKKLRSPIALVDEDDSTMTTPASKSQLSSVADSAVTPQIDNRTYSKVAPELGSTHDKDRQTRDGKLESKDSGNGSKDDFYLLTLSCIDRMLNGDLDTDVSDAAFIEQLLKNAKASKSPTSRGRQKPTQQTINKKSPVAADAKQVCMTEADTIADLLWGNKENVDPQKKHSSTSADTVSFTESLLNSSDSKELQRSVNQPRSPLSPLQLNIPQFKLITDEGHEADIDEWPTMTDEGTAATKAPAPRARSCSPHSTSSRTKVSPAKAVSSDNNKKTSANMKTSPRGPYSQPKKSPVTTGDQRPNSPRCATSTQLSMSSPSRNTAQTSKLPACTSANEAQLKPLSSTLLDERKTSDCDFATSPNLSKSNTHSSVNGTNTGELGEDTLTPNGSLRNGIGGCSSTSSPRSFLSSQPSSPAGSGGSSKRRGCGNCSPQLRTHADADRDYMNGGVRRATSSPSASESSVSTTANGVAPMRTVSSSSLRNGSSGGGVGRSVSRCSSSSEFSHRPGKSVPLKVTNLELSWGSTRLRSGVRKSMQVKNIANKRLMLRIEVCGPGYKLENMHSSTLTLQSQECRTIVVNFCPTVVGVAIGKLSFYAPQGTLSSSATTYTSFLDIPLNGYGGHCSVLAQEVNIGPLGMPFLQLGYLHELGQPLERTITIFNKGPLLGFALLSIDSVGLRLPRLCDAFDVQPTAMLIAAGSAATVRVVFRPQREDVRKITRQTKTVMTLANLRLISGDEANRQRMRRLVQGMSKEERAKVSPARSLDMLWSELPEEQQMSELDMFRENPSVTFDLLTHMRVHEVALTINDDSMDETIKSSSSLYFPDGDETVLFRTVCSPTPSPEPGLDRVEELLEEEELDGGNVAANAVRAGFWSVVPDKITFHLGEKRPVLRACLFICNSFKSRQYFEVTCNRNDILRLEPSEGYVEPDGGHMEVEVHLQLEKLTVPNKSKCEAATITVCMENERVVVPVKIRDDARPLERAVRS